MRKPFRVQIGSSTVKQYGRFHLKRHDVYRGNQEIPSYRYWITVENGDGSEDDIGLIVIKESTFPRFINHVQVWLREQSLHLSHTHQQAEESLQKGEGSEEEIQGQQNHIQEIQERYDRVVQALGEIAPTVRFDEFLLPPLQNESKEEKQI